MKNNVNLILLLFICLGCNSSTKKKNVPKNDTIDNKHYKEIPFQVTTDDREVFEDGIIPWISIKEPELQIDNLIGKDEIVLKSSQAVLFIDYPLAKPVEIVIASIDPKGFTRGELIRRISKAYKRIYQEEENSTKVEVIPLEEREGLINRNKTDGKYGIWGHDIDDLDLSTIIVHPRKNQLPKLELYVES